MPEVSPAAPQAAKPLLQELLPTVLLGAGVDLDAVVGSDAVDQVARHALLERVGTADDGDASSYVCELQRCLSSRVSAADDDNVAVAAERGLRWRRAVVHAGADEVVDA